MISKKEHLINFLRFGGVSKADFSKVKASIAEENHKVWKVAASILEVIFLIAFIITASIPGYKDYVVGYMILVAYFVIVGIFLLTFVNSQSVFFKPLIYVSSVVLIGVVLYQAFVASDSGRNIGTYCAVIVATAVLCIDRPYRFCILIFLSTVAFVVMSLLFQKANSPLYPDLYVGIVFGIVSIIITLYVNHIRIKDIVLRYNAEQERDIDTLTGMKNNNAYNRMISTLMAKANKAEFEFAFVVFDINGLKITNDTYGHEAGDKLLIRATALINECFPNSQIFRIGGDEFAAFITGKDYENRDNIVKNFQKRVGDIHEASHELNEDTSIACGCAAYNPRIDRDFVSLFSRADANMYENKRHIKAKNKPIV